MEHFGLWSVAADGSRTLEGAIVFHVDDLLFTGSHKAEQSLMSIGAEMGFGSVDRDDFVWRGKRIRRHSDGTIRISMVVYHENASGIIIEKHRKSDPTAALNPVKLASYEL